MAKEFAFKDARILVKKIKDVLRQLDETIFYPELKSREISTIFSSLYASDYFRRFAEEELSGKDFAVNDTFKRLVLSLYQAIETSKLIAHAKELVTQINADTGEDTALLASCANPVVWVFTSAKKKQAAAEAYKRTSLYASSYIIEDCLSIFDSLVRINATAPDDAFTNFSNGKTEYFDFLKTVVASTDAKQKLAAVKTIDDDLDAINGKIVEVKDEVAKQKTAVKEAIDRLVNEELYKILRDIPIDEINRDKKGFRIKTLKDAGYENMADVMNASPYGLAAVNGISVDNAHAIKVVAEEFAKQAKNGIRIKITYDEQTESATEVVKRIYACRLLARFEGEIDAVLAKYRKYVTAARKSIDKIGSGRFWAFYEDDEKAKIKSVFSDLRSLISGELGKPVSDAYMNFFNVDVDVTAPDAWEDFKVNSIEYFNLIEDICPGLLGNDDSRYGLPEDLAKEVQNECLFPDGLKCTLRRYQEWGVKYILHQERVLLGDEMGLGKTVQAIASMVSLRNTGATHFVVVCPASVITNWCREIAKHSFLSVVKAHGANKAGVIGNWVEQGGVVVTTYESTSAFKLEDDFKFSELIVDEAHYIKNRSAARTMRTIELSKHAERVVFMTGTALENKVDEMISLIDVLQPNVAAEVRRIAFMSTAPKFREKVAPVYYRRKREDVLTELPDLIENEEWCDMTFEEEAVYEEAVLSKNYMLSRRVSFNIDDMEKSSKMNRLKEIVEDAKNDDRKVLIFSFFLDTIQKICYTLGSEVCLPAISGSVTPSRRQSIIDEFDAAPAGTVLCAQIQSGGTGLNIQAASVVVICEPQLKPSIENQAVSRAYRMGQSRNVQVFRLLCDETIDERILDILKEKQAVFDVFADRSIAAEKIEIDDKGLKGIIEEEIDRINRKRGAALDGGEENGDGGQGNEPSAEPDEPSDEPSAEPAEPSDEPSAEPAEPDEGEPSELDEGEATEDEPEQDKRQAEGNA